MRLVVCCAVLSLCACQSLTPADRTQLIQAGAAIGDAASVPACAALNAAIAQPELTQPCVAISGEIITYAESKALAKTAH